MCFFSIPLLLLLLLVTIVIGLVTVTVYYDCGDGDDVDDGVDARIIARITITIIIGVRTHSTSAVVLLRTMVVLQLF